MKLTNDFRSYLILLISLFQFSRTYAIVPATWMQTQLVFVRKHVAVSSNQQQLTPNYTATITYGKTYSAVPQVVTAVHRYLGNSSIAPQVGFYAYQITGPTTTSFGCNIVYPSYTHYFQFMYLAIDTSFPHYLKVYSNKGFTPSLSTTYTALQSYSMNIAISPVLTGALSNYKVLVWASCFNVMGTTQPAGVTYVPSLNLTASLSSSSNIILGATIGSYTKINYTHITVLVVDQYSINNSPNYRVGFDRVLFTSQGGQIYLPQGLDNSIFMGFTDYVGTSNSQYISFYLSYKALSNGSYGIQFPAPTPQGVSVPNYGISYFYVRALNCPTNYYLDTSNYSCIQCTVIPNCLTCSSNTVCKSCQIGYSMGAGNSSCTKIICSDSNCLLCSSATVCILCDYNNSYYLSVGNCLLCNSVNMFINMSDPTYPCISCNIVGCTTCASLYTCSICNNGGGYWLNNNDSLCYTCSSTVSNCQTCTNYMVCGTCTSPKVLNSSDITANGQCIACPILGCSTCMDISNCQICDFGNGYGMLTNNTCQLCDTNNQIFINTTSKLCQPCSLPHCTTCSSFSYCSLCDTATNYYNSSGSCQYCDPTLNNFINPATYYTCDHCTLTQCQTCINLTACSVCVSGSNYFINPATSLCQICTTTVSRCQTCSNFMVCTLCISPYVLNSTDTTSNGQCISCPLLGCTTCTDINNCQLCDFGNGYGILPNNTCQLCDTANQIFINSTSKLCQQCSIPHCSLCSSLVFCSLCDTAANYYNSTGTCLYCDPLLNNFINPATYYTCDHCTLTQCTTCLSLSRCGLCNNGANYVLNPTTQLCQLCSIPHCLHCSTTFGICQTCDNANQYFLNSNNGQCQFYSAQFNKITKQGCNGFLINIKIDNILYNIVHNNIKILNNDVYTLKIQQISSTQIQIHSQYMRSLLNQSIQLYISPSQTLQIDYSPLIPPLYYSFTQCQSNNNVQNVVLAFQVISYGNLIFSLLSCKIVGLELFGVLQLAYFTLSSHSFLNIYMGPLIKLKTMNGININSLSSNNNNDNNNNDKDKTNKVPPAMKNMGISSTFLNNCNIMLFILLGQFVIAAIMYLISRLMIWPKIQTYSIQFLKQGLITLILFNSFNLSFSAGVHWRYATPQDDYYTLSSVLVVVALAVVFIAAVAMQFTSQNTYGEFKNKFKKSWQCKIFIPVTVLYRMCLGFYCSVKTQYSYSTIMAMGIALAFFMYVMINLPFKDASQNYRTCICHATMLFILFTTNYYRTMKDNTPLQIKASIYTPAIIQLIMIGLCIGVSTAVLIYQIYQIIRNILKSRKVTDQLQQNSTTNITSDNIINNNSNIIMNSNTINHINATQMNIMEDQMNRNQGYRENVQRRQFA